MILYSDLLQLFYLCVKAVAFGQKGLENSKKNNPYGEASNLQGRLPVSFRDWDFLGGSGLLLSTNFMFSMALEGWILDARHQRSNCFNPIDSKMASIWVFIQSKQWQLLDELLTRWFSVSLETSFCIFVWLHQVLPCHPLFVFSFIPNITFIWGSWGYNFLSDSRQQNVFNANTNFHLFYFLITDDS